MDMSEVEYQIGFFVNKLNTASSDEDRKMYANMLNTWHMTRLKLLAEQHDKRKARLKKNVEKLGQVENLVVEFSSWEAWAHSLYDIKKHEDGYIVRSRALNWSEEKTWNVDCDVGALEKILQLVRYKIADRKRGYGDIFKDLGMPHDEA